MDAERTFAIGDWVRFRLGSQYKYTTITGDSAYVDGYLARVIPEGDIEMDDGDCRVEVLTGDGKYGPVTTWSNVRPWHLERTEPTVEEMSAWMLTELSR
jgi:hypothetical protein